MSDFAYATEYHILRGGWCQIFRRVSRGGQRPIIARSANLPPTSKEFVVNDRDYHAASMCPLQDRHGTTLCYCCQQQRRYIGHRLPDLCGACLEAGCTSTRVDGRFGFFSCKLSA